MLDILNELEQEAQEAREMAEKVFKMVPMFLGEKAHKVEEWLQKVTVCETLLPGGDHVTEAQKVAHLKLRMERMAFAWANMLPAASMASLQAFKDAICARFVLEAD